MDNKKSAVIRIVCYSVVVILLAVLLIMGISGRWNNGFFSFNLIGGSYYSDADKYQAGSAEIDGNAVTDLDVDWMDGQVNIEVYDGNTVKISEKSSKKLEEKEQLHYYNKNGRLMIQYRESSRKVLNFGGYDYNKELTIKIPAKTAEEMGYIGVDTVSSDIRITGISGDKFNIDTTSGSVELNRCKASQIFVDTTSGDLSCTGVSAEKEFNADTVSGKIDVEGSIRRFNADSISGSIKLSSAVCPEQVSTDTVSGSATLLIPENEGFRFEKDTVSGSFESDFEISFRDERGTYKDGGDGASFRFESVSGSIKIKKR